MTGKHLLAVADAQFLAERAVFDDVAMSVPEYAGGFDSYGPMDADNGFQSFGFAGTEYRLTHVFTLTGTGGQSELRLDARTPDGWVRVRAVPFDRTGLVHLDDRTAQLPADAAAVFYFLMTGLPG